MHHGQIVIQMWTYGKTVQSTCIIFFIQWHGALRLWNPSPVIPEAAKSLRHMFFDIHGFSMQENDMCMQWGGGGVLVCMGGMQICTKDCRIYGAGCEGAVLRCMERYVGWVGV